MPENPSELADLRREHEIDVESIESSESLAQILDCALQECKRQMAKKTPTRSGLKQLHGLIRLAHQARHHADSAGVAERDAACAGDDASVKLGALFDELLGLCHKINNPLTALLGRAQIMQLKLGAETESPFAKPIRVVEESGQRIAALVQQLANSLCLGRKVFADQAPRNYDSSSSSDGR